MSLDDADLKATSNFEEGSEVGSSFLESSKDEAPAEEITREKKSHLPIIATPKTKKDSRYSAFTVVHPSPTTATASAASSADVNVNESSSRVSSSERGSFLEDTHANTAASASDKMATESAVVSSTKLKSSSASGFLSYQSFLAECGMAARTAAYHHQEMAAFGMTMPPFPSPVSIFARRRRKENRPRRQRTTFSSEQTHHLELEYNRTEYITRPRRFELAEILDLTENQIKIWFQNRRAKDKRIEKAQIDQHYRSVMAANGAAYFGSPTSYHAHAHPSLCPAHCYKSSSGVGTIPTVPTVPAATHQYHHHHPLL